MEYILADNQDVTREGLISFVKEADSRAGVVSALSCRELQAALRRFPQSVVVADYALFDFASVHHLLNMKSGARESRWLLFSDETDENFLQQVLLADSTFGVVMKNSRKGQIIDALMCAAARETYWCELAQSVMANGIPHTKIPDTLTASEKNVLREIALGKTTKEIASDKHLSFHTVNTHRRNIFRKIGVNNVHEATKYALQAGLVDLMEYYI